MIPPCLVRGALILNCRVRKVSGEVSFGKFMLRVNHRMRLEDDEKYIARYEHICWQKWGKEALIQDVHHQGMDYIMLRMLAADFRGEMTYPITAGDLALWTSVSPYSKLSIAGKRTVFL